MSINDIIESFFLFTIDIAVSLTVEFDCYEAFGPHFLQNLKNTTTW